MTRLTKIYTICMAFLLMSISLDIAAETTNMSCDDSRIPRTNWVNSMGHPGDEMCIALLADDILRIKLFIGMGSDQLTQFPPLRVAYDWGGIVTGVTPTITANDLTPVLINGYNGFEAQFVFTIQFNDMCSGASIPDPWNFDFSYDLVTSNGTGGSDLYPVLQENVLFPPYMFTELNDPSYTPEYSGSKTLCCTEGIGLGMVAPGNETMDALALQSTSTSNDLAETPVSNWAPINAHAADASNFETMNIFPNPANDQINVKLAISNSDYFQIDILNLNGEVIQSIYRKISQDGDYQETVDISSLPPGIYFCRLSSATHLQSNKVIKL